MHIPFFGAVFLCQVVLPPFPVAAQNDDGEASPKTWGHYLPLPTPSELLSLVLPMVTEQSSYIYSVNYHHKYYQQQENYEKVRPGSQIYSH